MEISGRWSWGESIISFHQDGLGCQDSHFESVKSFLCRRKDAGGMLRCGAIRLADKVRHFTQERRVPSPVLSTRADLVIL